MPYGRMIAFCLPLMIAAAIVGIFLVPWQLAVIGHSIGIPGGAIIAHRGVRLVKAHIIHRKRAAFGPMRRPAGILVLFVLPVFAGFGLGILYQFQPWIVAMVLIAGAGCVATWWLLMGWWVWHVQRRTGRDVLLLMDGFCLSPKKVEP